ncbi:MAG: diacylglycerol kinase family lipid kinase [Eubacterium sp.]|nr:diacylglycerol kinase family lipid kinase [Eubacterium sp.]
MAREKTLFIYNPNSGTGAIKNKLSQVIEVFMRAGLDVNIFATGKHGDATQIIHSRLGKKSTRFRRVICAGGDGTLHEVVQGLMDLPPELRPPCGYIPVGTMNDFSNGLKLPRNIVKSAEIASGRVSSLFDIGTMDDEPFVYVAGFGAFTAVSYDTSQQAKNLMGWLAYFFRGISELGAIKSIHVRVETEDETWEDDVIIGIVTNAKTVGGQKIFRKTDVRLDDGLFEGIFVKTPKNPIELNRILGSFIFSDFGPQIKTFLCKKFTIETSEPVPYTMDGENGGIRKRVEITNRQQAVRFFHGQDAEPKKKKPMKTIEKR